jgi:hypothetical protein
MSNLPRVRGRAGARSVFAAALSLSLVLAGVAPAAGNAPKAGSYKGESSEKSPVTFKVARRGAAVLGFKATIGYDGKCGQGGGPGFEAAIAKIPIEHGRFSTTSTFKGEVPGIPPKKGKVSGRFSGKTVSGTVVIPSLKSGGCRSYAETYVASWEHA